jgi:hypothetical protein
LYHKGITSIKRLTAADATASQSSYDDLRYALRLELKAFDKSLDADIIICAQYKLLEREYPSRYIVIATTNVKHLSRFAEAKEWQEIEF